LSFAAYYLLRVSPGVDWSEKVLSFAQSIKIAVDDCCAIALFDGTVISKWYTFSTRMDHYNKNHRGSHWLTDSEFCIRQKSGTAAEYEDNVKIDMKFWFGTMSGSPDKLSNQALMVTCMGPR
jgi:hypothetical protein